MDKVTPTSYLWDHLMLEQDASLLKMKVIEHAINKPLESENVKVLK